MRQGQKDIQLAAAIATIALALFAIASWVQRWPSTVISQVLLLVGAGAVLIGLSIETISLLASVRGWRRVPVLASRLLLDAILVIAMLALPLLTMAIGALVLASLLAYGLVKLVPRAKARYRPTRADPRPLARTTPPHAP